MGWQTRVDRLILREMESAVAHPERRDDARELLVDFLRLKPGRPESLFAAGFAHGAFDVSLDAYPVEELDEESALWHRFGRVLSGLRETQEEGGEAPSDEAHASADVSDLLQDARIAKELLPILLKRSLASGDLTQAVRTLETVLSSGAPDDETGDLLRGTLSEILRRAERPRERLETAAVLDLLRRCMALPGFDELPAELRAPFHRTLGKLHQHMEDYEDAADQFRSALEIAGEGHTLGSVLHFDLAACLLGIRGVPDLQPNPDRGPSDEALEQLDKATSDPKRASFNAYFTRGILRFEQGQFEDAGADFHAALDRIETYRNPLPVTLARMRYFLAMSWLRSSRPEDREEAVRQLEKSLERVRPSLSTIEEVLPLLRDEHPRAARRLLSRIDLAHAEPEDAVRVGEAYRDFGEAESAHKVAQIALERTEDLDLRKRALELELQSANMQGYGDEARDTYYELRDVCYRSGDLATWERVLFDDDRVAPVIDRTRILGERIELLGRLPGREDERFALIREVAQSYLDRAEPHWKIVGVRLFRDAARIHPGVFDGDLADAEALVEVDEPGDDEVRGVVETMGRAPSLLVIGGDDHQDRREDDLDAITQAWGIEAEWWAADPTRPDDVMDTLQERCNTNPPDGVLILHWTRPDVAQDIRKLTRHHRVTMRSCFHVGFDALRQGVADLVDAVHHRRSGAAGA